MVLKVQKRVVFSNENMVFKSSKKCCAVSQRKLINLKCGFKNPKGCFVSKKPCQMKIWFLKVQKVLPKKPSQIKS